MSTEYPQITRLDDVTVTVTHNRYGRMDHHTFAAVVEPDEDGSLYFWIERTDELGMNGGGVASTNVLRDERTVWDGPMPDADELRDLAKDAADQFEADETSRLTD